METPTRLWPHHSGMYCAAIQRHNGGHNSLEVKDVTFWLERCQFESLDCLGQCERGGYFNAIFSLRWPCCTGAKFPKCARPHVTLSTPANIWLFGKLVWQ